MSRRAMRQRGGRMIRSGDGLNSGPPIVTSVTPDYGFTRASGIRTVTINGSNFYPGCTATIDGVAVASLVRLSSSLLQGVVGAIGSDGLKTAAVTNPDLQVGNRSNAYLAVQMDRWYDPRVASSVANPSAITQVNDLSGNNQHATQASAGARPLIETFNGQSWIRAANSRWLLIPSMSSFTAAEMLGVFSGDGTTLSAHALWGTGDGTIDFIPYLDNVSIFDGFGSNARYSAGVVAGLTVPHTYNVVSTSTEWTNFVNGIQAFTTGSNTVSFHANGMSWGASGSNPAAPSNFYDGHLGEMAIRSAKLSSVLKAEARRRMAASWGTPFPNYIMCEGDSLTVGQGVSIPYPTRLATLLGSGWVVQQNGTSGDTAANMVTNAPTDIDPKYNYAAYRNSICIFWAGTNDLFFGANATTTYNSIVSFCTGRRAVGWKVIVGTILPRVIGGGGQAVFNADRATVNTNIRSNWATFADGIADFAADPRIGDDGDNTDTTYYQGDFTHLNDNGMAVVAPIAQAPALTLVA